LLSSFFCGPVSSFGDYSFFRCKAFWEMWCTGTVQYVGKSAFFDDQLWRVRLHGWAENGIVMEKAFEYEQKNGNVVCEKSEAFWKLMVKNGLSSGWWHSDHE
jgi:major membrane immunogen (membrane-anchored lipoprotein)